MYFTRSLPSIIQPVLSFKSYVHLDDLLVLSSVPSSLTLKAAMKPFSGAPESWGAGWEATPSCLARKMQTLPSVKKGETSDSLALLSMQSWGGEKGVLPSSKGEHSGQERTPLGEGPIGSTSSFVDPQTSFRLALYNCNINLTFHFYSSLLKRKE